MLDDLPATAQTIEIRVGGSAFNIPNPRLMPPGHPQQAVMMLFLAVHRELQGVGGALRTLICAVDTLAATTFLDGQPDHVRECFEEIKRNAAAIAAQIAQPEAKA